MLVLGCNSLLHIQPLVWEWLHKLLSHGKDAITKYEIRCVSVISWKWVRLGQTNLVVVHNIFVQSVALKISLSDI